MTVLPDGQLIMSQLLLNMAQKAVNDSSLMAGFIDNYTKQTGSSWAEVAGELQISPTQLARLALCRHPNGNAHQEIRQIADYIKMSPVVLNRFYERAQNGETLTSRTVVRSRKTVETSKKKPFKQSSIYSIGSNFMSKRFVWTAGLVVVLLLIMSAFVLAQATAVSEATLVVNSGEVTITRGEKTGTAVPGEAVVVSEGDTVTTSVTATAQLHLADGGTVDLFEATSVEITELVTTDEKYQVTLTMLAGRTLNRVVHLLGIEDHYEVRSPSSTASVRGTVFTVDILSQESTYFGVDEGVVNVAMDDQSVDVEAGFEVTAVTGELLMVKPQGRELSPTPVPTPTMVPTPTEVPPTVEPTPQPAPTEEPEEAAVVVIKNASKLKNELLVIMPEMPALPPPAVGAGNPVDDGQFGDSLSDGDDSSDENSNDNNGNGGNPNSDMVVPGNTPGDGQTPEGGAEPPGQGGTPPGQSTDPGNSGNSNGGGKKDK